MFFSNERWRWWLVLLNSLTAAPQVDRASIFDASSCPAAVSASRFKRIREKFVYAKWSGTARIGFGHRVFKCNEICPPDEIQYESKWEIFPFETTYPSFMSTDGSIKQSAVKEKSWGEEKMKMGLTMWKLFSRNNLFQSNSEVKVQPLKIFTFMKILLVMN